MIRQLAHLNFVTNDLSRIIDFYVNKLGIDSFGQARILDLSSVYSIIRSSSSNQRTP